MVKIEKKVSKKEARKGSIAIIRSKTIATKEAKGIACCTNTKIMNTAQDKKSKDRHRKG